MVKKMVSDTLYYLNCTIRNLNTSHEYKTIQKDLIAIEEDLKNMRFRDYSSLSQYYSERDIKMTDKQLSIQIKIINLYIATIREQLLLENGEQDEEVNEIIVQLFNINDFLDFIQN